MTSTQNHKRYLFRRRVSSEPKIEHLNTVIMGRKEFRLSPNVNQFRSRAKSAEPKSSKSPKSSKKNTPTMTRRYSKTFSCLNVELNDNSFKCFVDGRTESFMVQESVPKYNFVVLGVAKVGKTNLINFITTSTFKNFLNIDYIECTAPNTVSLLMNGQEFELSFFEVDIKNDLWQTVTAAGYLILYDVDKENSFVSAVDILSKLRKGHKSGHLDPMILVGNKTTDIRRRVSKEKAKLAAKQNACNFIEVSLVNGRNIDILLTIIINCVTDNKILLSNQQNQIDDSPTTGCAQLSKAHRTLMNRVTGSLRAKRSKSAENLFLFRL